MKDEMTAGDAAKTLFLTAIMIGGAWVGWSSFFGVGSTDIKIAAEDLYIAYAKNPASAFAQFDKKTAEVSGPVRSVSMRGSTPILYVGPLIVNVACELPSSAAGRVGALKPGDAVTVRGRVRSNGSTARLKPCELM